MKSIGIKNLRSLKNVEQIEIKPITILVGRNSSGKSTFLRIFPLLKQTLEAKTAEPILWYGKYVDFGDYDQSKTHNEKEDIELTFGLEIPDVSKISTKSIVFVDDRDKKMEATATFSLKKQVVSSINVSIKDQNFRLNFNSLSEVDSIEVNGNTFNERYFTNYNRGALLPEIVMVSDKNDQMGVSLYRYFINEELLNQIVQYLKRYSNSNTKDRTIAAGIRPELFGSHKEVLKHLTNTTAFPEGMRKNLNKASVDDENIKKINDYLSHKYKCYIDILYVTDDAEGSYNKGILSYLDKQYVDVFFSGFTGVRYSKPLRLNAERYRRIQGLSVNEVDPSGENLEMVLNNLREKEQKAFSQWTKSTIGCEFSTVQKDGHVSILVKDSRTNIKENLVDTGFGYSQILPILLSVWKVNMSENSSVRRFLYGYIGGQSADYYEAIEQPELHLHPAMQAKVIDVFSQLASEENGGKIKFVLETHSEAMINRLGYLINKKKLLPEMVNVVIFDKDDTGNTKVSQTKFNEKGQLEKWPIGFFDPDEV